MTVLKGSVYKMKSRGPRKSIEKLEYRCFCVLNINIERTVLLMRFDPREREREREREKWKKCQTRMKDVQEQNDPPIY